LRAVIKIVFEMTDLVDVSHTFSVFV